MRKRPIWPGRWFASGDEREDGPADLREEGAGNFLGAEINQHRDYSEYTAIEIDNEVRRLVTENYERAKTLITNNMKALKALAEALLEKESLDAPEIDRILQSSISPSPA